MRCRRVGGGLLWFYLISVAATVVPFQLAAAAWYLTLCAALVNNSPVLVLAYLAISLGAYHNPEQSVNRGGSFQWPWAGLSRVSTVVFAAVVVIQLAAAVVLYQQSAANSRRQLSGLDKEIGRISARLNGATTPGQLQEVLQSFTNGAGLRSIAPGLDPNQPLSTSKATLQQGLQRISLTAYRRANQQKRELATNLVISSVRVSLGAVVIAAISLSFARWQG